MGVGRTCFLLERGQGSFPTATMTAIWGSKSGLSQHQALGTRSLATEVGVLLLLQVQWGAWGAKQVGCPGTCLCWTRTEEGSVKWLSRLHC